MTATPLPVLRSSLRRSITRLVLGVSVGWVAACGPDDDRQTIERDVFIRTYADLRVAAVSTDSQRIALADRDSILASHGVTPVDLELFAEVHSVDLDFMRDVWNEVERLMDREPEVGN